MEEPVAEGFDTDGRVGRRDQVKQGGLSEQIQVAGQGLLGRSSGRRHGNAAPVPLHSRNRLTVDRAQLLKPLRFGQDSAVPPDEQQETPEGPEEPDEEEPEPEPPQPPEEIPEGILVDEIPDDADILFVSMRYVFNDLDCLTDEYEIKSNFLNDPDCLEKIFNTESNVLASPRQLYALDIETGNVIQLTNVNYDFSSCKPVDSARIMAVGLTSVLLAFVANYMAGRIGSVWAGIAVAVLLHIFNLLLGVFAPTIHSLRLHYVEFLSKFMESGGKEFKPLGRKL